MFTGIISNTSSVRVSQSQASDKGMTLTFDQPASWTDLLPGESINTNGICLTVSATAEHEYDCFVVPETLARTSFGKKLPKRVNLERSLTLNGRLNGHLVQGHVDGIGHVASIDKSDGLRLSVTFDPAKRDLVIEKGSITIDGISLTVAALRGNVVEIAVVPYTLEHSTIGELQVGDNVNLEFDIIGKYVLSNLKKTPHSID